MWRTWSKGQLRSYLIYRLNLTSMQAVQILQGACIIFSRERRRFCFEPSVSCFALMSAFTFSQTLPLLSSSSFLSSLLECLLLVASNYSLTPHLLQCLTMSKLLQGNGRESLWPGRLITVCSLSWNDVRWTDGTLVCHWIGVDLSYVPKHVLFLHCATFQMMRFIYSLPTNNFL